MSHLYNVMSRQGVMSHENRVTTHSYSSEVHTTTPVYGSACKESLSHLNDGRSLYGVMTHSYTVMTHSYIVMSRQGIMSQVYRGMSQVYEYMSHAYYSECTRPLRCARPALFIAVPVSSHVSLERIHVTRQQNTVPHILL